VARKDRPGAPKGRALQAEDLDPEGLRAAKENWAQMGMGRQRIGGAIEEAQRAQAESKNPEYKKKMGHRASSLKAIEPHVEDKPITTFGAITQRVKLAHAGRERARQEGGMSGADWFFEHHNLIRSAAQEQGFHPHAGITATTALSPLNAPETERPAGHAVMRLVNEPHTVTISPELHAATKAGIKKMGGPPIPKEHVGKQVKVEDLHHTHVAAIAAMDAKMRNKGTPTQSSAPEAFTALGATRLSSQAAQSIAHLRGHATEEEAISPHTSPKVWSYKESTKEAAPATAEHGEFGVRAYHWIHGDPNQTVLDLWKLRHSEKGILSSGREVGTGHTPEDTWMQSVSTRQTPANIGGGGRGVSVAKTMGSDPKLAGAEAMRKSAPSGASVADDPLIGGTALTHALNNQATRMASQKIPIRMGDVSTNMPVRMLHPMVWTEQRRQAEKDPEYKESQAAAARRAEVGGRQFEAEQTIAHRKAERKRSGQPAPTETRLPGEVLRTQRGQPRTRRGGIVRGPERTAPLPRRETQQSLFGESGEPTSASRIPRRYQRG